MANQVGPQDSGARTHERVRDKEATRQRLLDAAEAVFAEKGYHGAAVDDITRKSDSSKGGFYFHFPNKEAIFLALIDSLTPRLETAIERALSAESDPVTQLDAALQTVFETFSSHRRLSKILLVEAVGLGHGFDEKLMLVRGRFPLVDTETVAWAWFGAINEIVTRWLVSGRPRRLEDAFPALRALLLRSIGALPDDPSQAPRMEAQA
jgi:AcrR family transcriptional regulator